MTLGFVGVMLSFFGFCLILFLIGLYFKKKERREREKKNAKIIP